jgi:hypothetical protein
MSKLAIKAGSTSVKLYLFIQDSSVTTGAGLTGLAFNTASLVASYVRPVGSRVAITLATQTVTGGYSSGGFVEVDATNMPGLYRFDVPDAAIAIGVRSVVVMLKGATNMAPVVLEIDLLAEVSVAYWAGTELPAPDTAGYPKVTIKSGTGSGELAITSGQTALTSAGNTAVVDALYASTVENNGTITFKSAIRTALAALLGRTTVSGSTVTFKTADNAKTRVTTVTDSSNQRTTVTLDGTD